MEDPVILPSSRMIVDRVTIETHLLSDPKDPFNRANLTKEELISNDELKNKIQIYKKSKIK
jgi:ubiquitin conjugation factor E4 B